MFFMLEMLAVVGFYTAVFAYYQPRLLSMPSRIISDPMDGILNLWMLEHGLKSLPKFSLHDFWSGNIFYPLDATMSLSDTLLFQVFMTLPFTRLGIASITAYNISIYLFFIFAGCASYLGLRSMTNDRWISLLGSGMFTISGFWFGHIGHYQLLAIFWYPLVIFCLWKVFLFKHISNKRNLYWMLHGTCLLGLGFSSPYLFFLFIPSLAIVYICLWWCLRNEIQSQDWLWLVGVLVSVLIVLGVFFYPYLEAKAIFGMVRNTNEQALYSVRWKALNSHFGLYWPTLIFGPTQHYGEGQFYLSIVMKVGVISIAYWIFRGKISRLSKPQKVLMMLSLGLGVVCLLASMGPMNRTLGPLNIWKLMSPIPGFSGMRAPARLGFLTLLYFSGAITLYLSTLLPARYKRPFAVATLLLLILEMKPATILGGAYSEMHTAGLTQFLLSNNSKESTVVLPLDSQWDDLFILASKSDASFVNGRSGWTPYLHEHFIFPNIQDCSHQGCLDLLRSVGVRYIATSNSTAEIANTRDFLEGHVTRTYSDTWYSLYDLFPGRSVNSEEIRLYKGEDDFLASRSLDSDCEPARIVEATPTLDIENLQDSDPKSIWTSGDPQNNSQSIRISIPPNHGLAFAVKLSDNKSNIQTSGFVRKPIIRAFGPEGSEQKVTYWPNLAIEHGQLVQGLRIHSEVPVSLIEIRASVIRYVSMPWTVGSLELCRTPS